MEVGQKTEQKTEQENEEGTSAALVRIRDSDHEYLRILKAKQKIPSVSAVVREALEAYMGKVRERFGPQ